MLNIEALIAFVAVIDTGSFSAAAERLGQTPSGISRAVSRLESQLRMALITRTTRRLDLTEEGEWLLARARKVLSDLQDTEEQMVARLSQPSGLVRVNAATPVLDHLVAPLAAEFSVTLPWNQPVWTVFYKQGMLAPRIGALVNFLAQRLTGVLDE